MRVWVAVGVWVRWGWDRGALTPGLTLQLAHQTLALIEATYKMEHIYKIVYIYNKEYIYTKYIHVLITYLPQAGHEQCREIAWGIDRVRLQT